MWYFLKSVSCKHKKKKTTNQKLVQQTNKFLRNKDYLEKDYSPSDNRRYNLVITPTGSDLAGSLSNYAAVLKEELSKINKKELSTAFNLISKLIFRLNQRGIIQVQRTCYNCKYYKGNKKENHYCNLLESKLKAQDIRIDCQEFEEKVSR